MKQRALASSKNKNTMQVPVVKHLCMHAPISVLLCFSKREGKFKLHMRKDWKLTSSRNAKINVFKSSLH